MTQRHFDFLDQCILNIDQAARTLFGKPVTTARTNPALEEEEGDLSDSERDHIARLMRINHTGEICAQALYQGQALTARNDAVRKSMAESAIEENDHLDWCESRVKELGSHLSLLNPLWYAGSFLLGATAGAIGDKWSLGFVAETEKQVEGHLDEHLKQLPPQDQKSRAILEQMREDEIEHGKKARKHGAADLPTPITAAMRLSSKLMTGTVYYI